MRTVIDMTTGKILDDGFDAEFGEFKDEVLNAEWLPPSPDLQLGMPEVHAQEPAGDEVDAESFLSAVYRNQR